MNAVDMTNAYECPHQCGYCFRDAQLIECVNDRDTYKCNRCGCTFTESCTFDEDFD
jgi:hypothetical protein